MVVSDIYVFIISIVTGQYYSSSGR